MDMLQVVKDLDACLADPTGQFTSKERERLKAEATKQLGTSGIKTTWRDVLLTEEGIKGCQTLAVLYGGDPPKQLPRTALGATPKGGDASVIYTKRMGQMLDRRDDRGVAGGRVAAHEILHQQGHLDDEKDLPIMKGRQTRDDLR